MKSIASHWCGIRSKKSITASAPLLQPTALLPTGRCHINFSFVKKIVPAIRPLVRILWPLVKKITPVNSFIHHHHPLFPSLPPLSLYLSLSLSLSSASLSSHHHLIATHLVYLLNDRTDRIHDMDTARETHFINLINFRFVFSLRDLLLSCGLKISSEFATWRYFITALSSQSLRASVADYILFADRRAQPPFWYSRADISRSNQLRIPFPVHISRRFITTRYHVISS